GGGGGQEGAYSRFYHYARAAGSRDAVRLRSGLLPDRAADRRSGGGDPARRRPQEDSHPERSPHLFCGEYHGTRRAAAGLADSKKPPGSRQHRGRRSGRTQRQAPGCKVTPCKSANAKAEEWWTCWWKGGWTCIGRSTSPQRCARRCARARTTF